MSKSVTALSPSRVRGAGASTYFAAAAMLVSYLPFSAVNGTLGLIGRQVRAVTGDLAWVIGSFTIALVVGVLIEGLFAGKFGLRRATIGGLALTVAGSIIGLVGASLPALRAAEAIFGLGAGVVMSASLQLIAATSLSPASRTRAIAIWAAANVAGLGLGPFLAVVGNSVGGWASFYLPVAVLAAGVAIFGAIVAIEPVRTTPFPPGSRLRSISGRQFSAAGLARDRGSARVPVRRQCGCVHRFWPATSEVRITADIGRRSGCCPSRVCSLWRVPRLTCQILRGDSGAATGPLIISTVSPALHFWLLIILVAVATLVVIALLISTNRKVNS